MLTPEILSKYIGGDMGTNELLVHRVALFNEFDDILKLFLMVRLWHLKIK